MDETKFKSDDLEKHQSSPIDLDDIETKCYNFKLNVDGRRDVMILNEYKKLNNLDIVSLHWFLNEYNSYNRKDGTALERQYFSINELCYHLEKCCTKNSDDLMVSASYIKEKISNYLNSQSNYQIYLVVDNISKEPDLYHNPLDRIFGLLITNTDPCYCTNDKNLSIVVICANSFGKKIKAIGPYLLLFTYIKAHLINYDKIILEVSNNEVNLPEECSEIDNTVKLELLFNKVKAESTELAINLQKKKVNLKDISTYWKQIEQEIDKDEFMDESISLSWNNDWINSNIEQDDSLTKENLDTKKSSKESEDIFIDYHLSQIHKIIQYHDEPTIISIIRIAHILGVSKTDYGFDDIILVNDIDLDTDESRCCNIKIDNNIHCKEDDEDVDESYSEEDEDDEDEEDGEDDDEEDEEDEKDGEDDDEDEKDGEDDDEDEHDEEDGEDDEDDEEDDEDDEDLIDYYDYNERVSELYDHNITDLSKLLECYNVSNIPKNKDQVILAILKYEYWQTNDDLKEITTCDKYDFNNCDENIYSYVSSSGNFGTNYVKGKDQSKDLYCGFYERYGFRENPNLNIKDKCFDKDPLPSMEINIKDYKINELIDNLFFKRTLIKDYSEFCQE